MWRVAIDVRQIHDGDAMTGDNRFVVRTDDRWPAAVEQAGAAVVALARGRRLDYIVLGRPDLNSSVDPMRRRFGSDGARWS